MEFLKLLNTSAIVAQLICFLALFFILRSFLWKHFLGILDDRKARTESDLAKIEEAKKSAEGFSVQYQAKLKNIEAEAKVKMQEVIREGHEKAALIKEGAHKDAAKIIEKAESDIRLEIQNAKQALKEEIVKLVIDATGRVIEERLTPEGDRKIVEKFLEDVDRMP